MGKDDFQTRLPKKKFSAAKSVVATVRIIIHLLLRVRAIELNGERGAERAPARPNRNQVGRPKLLSAIAAACDSALRG
jgi:hypothetical protein